MFRKALAPAERTELGAKERKKLRRCLEAQFDARSVELLFQAVDRFYVLQFPKSKMLVYADEADPLLVDTTGGGDLFPTLYCLQLLPRFVKCTIHAAAGVDSVAGCAQIASAAVDAQSCSRSFGADEVCVLIVQGPVAVFAAACSSEQLGADPPEMIGYLLHHADDHLWQLGSKVRRKPLETAIEVEAEEDDSVSDDASEDDLARLLRKGKPRAVAAPSAATTQAKKGLPAAEKASAPKPAKKHGATEKKGLKNAKAPSSPPPAKGTKKPAQDAGKPSKPKPAPAKGKAAGKPESSDSEAESAQERKPRIPASQMDKLIREAFLNGIVLRLKDKELPLPAPSVWKDYIAPFAPRGTVLDVKDSSFKKLNKFFQQLAKEGMIEFEEAAQKGAPPQVSRIVRTHDAIEDFEPTVEAPRDEAEEELTAQRDYSRHNAVLRVVKPMSTLRKYLGDWEGEHLTVDEVRKRLRDTLKSLGQLAKEEVTVTAELDGDFGLGLLEAEAEAQAEEGQEGEEDKPRARAAVPRIKFDRLLERLRGHMEPCFVVTTPGGEKTLHKGEFEGVRIYAEKAHNKVVCRATGLELYGFDMEAVLADVCAHLNVAGHLADAPTGRPGQRELIVAGGMVDGLREFIEQRLRLPEDDIQVVNKVDKKKKKPGFLI